MQREAAVSKFDIEVDGRLIPAVAGQTVAAALIGAGIVVFRHTPAGAPRGIFCGMGVCFDCTVTVDGLAEQRACMTPVQRGMRVQLGNVWDVSGFSAHAGARDDDSR